MFKTIGVISTEFAQIMTINGGTNVVLTSNSTFTAFDKTKKIIVNLTGDFSASTTGNYAFDCGDLSTWTDVDIIIKSGCNLYADGGNGGNSSGGAGGAGGTALNVNGANSTGILSIDQGGAIRGGGGGGGAGTRLSVSNFTQVNLGKGETDCRSPATVYRGSGGGGGGQSGLTNSAGGARTTSTDGCGSFANGVAGSVGTVSGAGGGGGRGFTQYRADNGATCAACTTAYGIAGAAGREWGVQGNSSSGAGGAAGKWCDNRDHATWPNGYGTTSGGFTI